MSIIPDSREMVGLVRAVRLALEGSGGDEVPVDEFLEELHRQNYMVVCQSEFEEVEPIRQLPLGP